MREIKEHEHPREIKMGRGEGILLSFKPCRKITPMTIKIIN
jgi:hypothetical protein